MTDINRLTNIFTYCNDAGTNCSWIDHVLCSREVDALVDSVQVMMDFVTSDHKPLLVIFSEMIGDMQMVPQEDTDTKNLTYSDWDNANAVSINNYQMALDSLLSFMNISIHNIDDNAHTEIGEMHSAIDVYYSSVMTCISNACKMNLPVRHVGSGNRYAIAGWNDYIHEKHNMPRNAFMQ